MHTSVNIDCEGGCELSLNEARARHMHQDFLVQYSLTLARVTLHKVVNSTAELIWNRHGMLHENERAFRAGPG